MTRTNKFLLAVAFAGATLVSSAPETMARSLGVDAVGKPETFQIISDRNIFDAGRSLVEPKTNSELQVVEHIVLKGTMSYEDKSHAFFEGDSLSRQIETLGPQGAIAGCRILAIANNSVRIVTPGGRQIQLAVGGGMQRIGEGDWEPSAVESTAEKPGLIRSSVKPGTLRRRAQ